ncbi:MAG: thioredoxin family protein [Proteobacteria bacterium]|nr:thioredoxin family protein [Pseudomonadota bacterium]
MALTESRSLSLNTTAPGFSLPDTRTGTRVSLDDFAGKQALLVAFLCNHCPYVKHIANELGRFSREYTEKGLAMVGISANDVQGYPADHPDRMKEEAEARGYAFPYLYDESQDVAKAYGAACTPDFFLFDADRKLVYHGQFDGTRPGGGPVTGIDLRAATDLVLAGERPHAEQTPSVGCSIKWKPGKAP